MIEVNTKTQEKIAILQKQAGGKTEDKIEEWSIP